MGPFDYEMIDFAAAVVEIVGSVAVVFVADSTFPVASDVVPPASVALLGIVGHRAIVSLRPFPFVAEPVEAVCHLPMFDGQCPADLLPRVVVVGYLPRLTQQQPYQGGTFSQLRQHASLRQWPQSDPYYYSLAELLLQLVVVVAAVVPWHY